MRRRRSYRKNLRYMNKERRSSFKLYHNWLRRAFPNQSSPLCIIYLTSKSYSIPSNRIDRFTRNTACNLLLTTIYKLKKSSKWVEALKFIMTTRRSQKFPTSIIMHYTVAIVTFPSHLPKPLIPSAHPTTAIEKF